MRNHGRDINHVGPFNFKDLIAQLVSDFPIFFENMGFFTFMGMQWRAATLLGIGNAHSG